jgi:hypothetical protein
MPLRDHFHPPFANECQWNSFFFVWVCNIVERLNQDVLPEQYRAIPLIHRGSEPNFHDQDAFEVRVHDRDRRLVAAIEMVTPRNKCRLGPRRFFAVKCARYLRDQAAVIVVDPVTERQANLHGELMEVLGLPEDLSQAVSLPLYAVAYRLHELEDGPYLEMWPQELGVGEMLPTLPLWIAADLAVPVDFEEAHRLALEMLRLA